MLNSILKIQQRSFQIEICSEKNAWSEVKQIIGSNFKYETIEKPASKKKVENSKLNVKLFQYLSSLWFGDDSESFNLHNNALSNI